MCFNVRNNKECATLWVAQEDIVCYKILDKDMTSPYQGFQYKFNTKYKVNIRQPRTKDKDGNMMFKLHKIFNDDLIILSLSKGFHSYTSLQMAKRRLNRHVNVVNVVIVRCVIPKGSEFYQDSVDNEYVSNQIIAKTILK